METKITVTMDEERHKALRKYLKKKNGSSIEQELENALVFADGARIFLDDVLALRTIPG